MGYVDTGGGIELVTGGRGWETETGTMGCAIEVYNSGRGWEMEAGVMG